MKTFKSNRDVTQLLRNHPSYDTVKARVKQIIDAYGRSYSPENDGYVVLVEPDDVNRILNDLLMPYRLSEVSWEGVSMLNGHYNAFYLANNQFGINFLIPDEKWVNGVLRQSLEGSLNPE